MWTSVRCVAESHAATRYINSLGGGLGAASAARDGATGIGLDGAQVDSACLEEPVMFQSIAPAWSEGSTDGKRAGIQANVQRRRARRSPVARCCCSKLPHRCAFMRDTRNVKSECWFCPTHRRQIICNMHPGLGVSAALYLCPRTQERELLVPAKISISSYARCCTFEPCVILWHCICHGLSDPSVGGLSGSPYRHVGQYTTCDIPKYQSRPTGSNQKNQGGDARIRQRTQKSGRPATCCLQRRKRHTR